MYINTFKYQLSDVSCHLCTEYVKKQGCTASRCPWLKERIEAGAVGYREAVLETMPRDRGLHPRLSLLVKTYPGTLWSNIQHERRMENVKTIQGYRRRRDTALYYAAMYLLTANDDIYHRTANCFCRHGIEFDYATIRGITLYNYTLFTAAKSIYSKTGHITADDLADNQIVDAEALRLIVNAILIARYGLDAFKLRERGAGNEC